MSYARSTRAGASGSAGAQGAAVSRARPAAGASATAAPPSSRPRQRPFAEESDAPDWGRASALGAGIVIGALLGAGAALLFAPMSGADTRRLIATRAERLRTSAGDGWTELRDELRAATRRRRKALRRGVTRGRWAVADVLE